ncbi:MAG: response regulator transcription factor [Elusimicrobia bacterium]|nr:response regulator transcription factor [Elusimicrobiota bacterium]
MAATKTLLLVEDDGAARKGWAANLEREGYRVLESDGVNVAYNLFQQEKPDLIVLDMNLPDGNGVDFCKRVRNHKTLHATPVIMLTGRGEIDDKAAGFDAGVDQYLVKPVVTRELLLWVKALLNRLALDKEEGGQLEAGDLAIDPDSHLVRFRDVTVTNLTGKEFDLFYALVKRSPKVLTREWILSTLWKTVAVDNLADVHISKIRHKLPPALADRVQTVPGKGFRYFA